MKNSTVPVGVPVAGLIGATVAVNVTDWPYTGALGEKVTVVVEFAVAATVTVTAGEVLDAKLLSPEIIRRDRIGADGQGGGVVAWPRRRSRSRSPARSGR